jgi:hypothetical protein
VSRTAFRGETRIKNAIWANWALRLTLLSVLLCTPAAPPALAVEFSVSGFGTIGYAQSDRSYGYQRFIDDDGTLMRDSLVGLQVDAKLGDKFGATVQGKMAPSLNNDDHYAATVSWAFLSFRPSNDWLLRAGKLRLPLYLYSETLDVGATFDFARLPTEVYSVSPTNDYTGLSFSKNWGLDLGELSLDGYWGKTNFDFRFWLRDNIPPVQTAGPRFVPIDLDAAGLVLALKRNEDTYRVAVHHSVAEPANGVPFPQTYPFVTLAPGVGYYQVNASLPGPGVPTTDRITNVTITLGAEVNLPYDLRVISEYAQRIVHNNDIGPASTGAYASLLKRFGKWTPYVTYAFLRSKSSELDFYNAVNNNRVPEFIPGAAQINASQRAGADGIVVYDQSSWALGTSYSLTPTSKLKAEYLRVRVGQVTSLVDAPPGGDVRNQDINVISLSYSVVF